MRFSLRSAAHRWRSILLDGFSSISYGVVCLEDGVTQIFLEGFHRLTFAGYLFQVGQEFRRAPLHFLGGIADVLLFFNTELNQIGSVVDAAGIGINQAVDAFVA